MKEYDLYVPLTLNTGEPVSDELVTHVKKQLLDQFGGLTDFRHRNEGTWRMGNIVYRDEILILRVLAEDPHHAREMLGKVKEYLQHALHQRDILVIERDVVKV